MSDFDKVRAILDAADNGTVSDDELADSIARNLAPELLAVAEAAEEDAVLLHHFVHDDTPWSECDGARCVRRRAALDALHAKMKEEGS